MNDSNAVGLKDCYGNAMEKDHYGNSYSKGPDFHEYEVFKISPYEDSNGFIREVLTVAQRDKEKSDSTVLLFKVLEELGEYGTAKAGHKEVNESPKEELVDMIITLLSLYSLEGGTIEHMVQYGKLKLAKYNKKVGHENS